MKQKIVFFILLYMMMPVEPAKAKDKLVITTIANYFSESVEKSVIEGYQRAGIEIEIVKLPAERAIQLSNSGESDGELYRIKDINKIYTNLVMISAPVFYYDGVVFTKNVKVPVHGWESLAPYYIGYMRGIRVFEDNTIGMNRFGATSEDQLFQMLDQGRLDVVISTRISGLEILARLKLKGISVSEPPLVTAPVFHYLHKKNAELVPKLTAVFEQMQKEGRIREILEQTVQDLKKKVDDLK